MRSTSVQGCKSSAEGACTFVCKDKCSEVGIDSVKASGYKSLNRVQGGIRAQLLDM